jgi:hypothetical protein
MQNHTVENKKIFPKKKNVADFFLLADFFKNNNYVRHFDE